MKPYQVSKQINGLEYIENQERQRKAMASIIWWLSPSVVKSEPIKQSLLSRIGSFLYKYTVQPLKVLYNKMIDALAS